MYHFTSCFSFLGSICTMSDGMSRLPRSDPQPLASNCISSLRPFPHYPGMPALAVETQIRRILIYCREYGALEIVGRIVLVD